MKLCQGEKMNEELVRGNWCLLKDTRVYGCILGPGDTDQEGLMRNICTGLQTSGE